MSFRRRYRVWLIVSFVALVCTPVIAADQDRLELLLNRRIIGSLEPLVEIQLYCQAGVPKMAEFESAADWEAEAARLREAVLDGVVYRGEAARWRGAETNVEWLDTIPGGPGYRIKRLRFEAVPGMWIPALLYEPEKLSGKVPVVLNVNGHSAVGKVYEPKQLRCINQAKRGMLALNVEWLGMGQLRTDGFNHGTMNQLDLCGTSGLAPFYLSMKRGLDVLLSLANADPERVAVTGLSGGGWQTIVISSLDTRVTLADPVAGYSSYHTRAVHLKDLGDSEQTPSDLATLVDYTHLTAMMAPRPLLLTYNAKDNCCFESGYAMQPLVDAAAPAFELFDRRDALRTHVNYQPGTHNYEQDNREALYRMLGAFFYAGDERFNPVEIESEGELKTAEELTVPLPDDNQDFHTLALRLSRELPRQPQLPESKSDAIEWQKSRRSALRSIVRAKQYEVEAIRLGSETIDDVRATFWRLRLGDAWTLPAVELVSGDAGRTAILINEAGRAAAAADAARLLAAGYRVLAVDPVFIGESRIPGKGILYPLLVAAIGDRPLGLQASQTAAIAGWSMAEFKSPPVLLCARGPQATTAALIAAALEEEAVGRLELHEALGSLKEVIEQNWNARNTPEIFCFGLLESFDVEQLVALVAPRQVTFAEPSDRARAELAGLGAWYGLLGTEFSPVR